MRFGTVLIWMTIAALTGIDPWFLAQIEDLDSGEEELSADGVGALDEDALAAPETQGFF